MPEPKAVEKKDVKSEAEKAAESDAKVMSKADVRDLLLLELADRVIAHPEGLTDKVSNLRGELAEDMGLKNTRTDDQIVQDPKKRADERQANIDLAVAAAIKEGLVPEDHKPGEDAKPGDPQPTTVSVPAGVKASELKPDKPAEGKK